MHVYQRTKWLKPKNFFCYRINNKIWVSNMEVAVESVGGWLEEMHKEQR